MLFKDFLIKYPTCIACGSEWDSINQKTNYLNGKISAGLTCAQCNRTKSPKTTPYFSVKDNEWCEETIGYLDSFVSSISYTEKPWLTYLLVGNLDKDIINLRLYKRLLLITEFNVSISELENYFNPTSLEKIFENIILFS